MTDVAPSPYAAEKPAPAASTDVKVDVVEQPVELTGFRAKAVDLVNQKLRNYTDPWALAVRIGAVCAAFFVVTFVFMLTACPIENSGLVVGSAEEHIKKIQDGSLDCVNAVVFLTPVEVDYTNGHHGRIEMMQQHACAADLSALGMDYCADAYKGEMTDCPGSGNALADLYGIYYNEKMCPTVSVAFGAALGYLGRIEMLVTIIVVYTLSKTGRVKPLNKDATLFSTATAQSKNDVEIESLWREINLLKSRSDKANGIVAQPNLL